MFLFKLFVMTSWCTVSVVKWIVVFAELMMQKWYIMMLRLWSWLMLATHGLSLNRRCFHITLQ